MKKFIRFFAVAMMAMVALGSYAQGIKFEENSSYAEALAKAKKENKILFVDFYTEWCIPCKQMNQYLFSQTKVGAAVNSDFIAIRIDAEKGDGIELVRRYNISGYPTLLFVNQEDSEICRLIGAPTNSAFFQEVLMIAKGAKFDLSAMYDTYMAAQGADKLSAAQAILRVAPAYYSVKMNAEEASQWRAKCREVAKFYLEQKKIENMINQHDFDIISAFMTNLTSENERAQYIYKNYAKFKAAVDEYDLAAFVVNMNNRSIQSASREGDLIWKKYVALINNELKEAYAYLGEVKPRETMDLVARVNTAISEKDFDRFLYVSDRYLQFMTEIGQLQQGQYMYSAQTLLKRNKDNMSDKQIAKGIQWLNKNIEQGFNLPGSYMLLGDYYALMPGMTKESIAAYNKCGAEASKQGQNVYRYYLPTLREKINALKTKELKDKEEKEKMQQQRGAVGHGNFRLH